MLWHLGSYMEFGLSQASQITRIIEMGPDARIDRNNGMPVTEGLRGRECLARR